MRDYLQYVYDESKQFYERGVTAEEAAKRIDLGPYTNWTQPERVVFNVDRAYRELRGGAWDEARIKVAMDALEGDYTPLTDMRGSADYRMRAARNLLFKFFVETAEPTDETRVLETAHG